MLADAIIKTQTGRCLLLRLKQASVKPIVFSYYISWLWLAYQKVWQSPKGPRLCVLQTYSVHPQLVSAFIYIVRHLMLWEQIAHLLSPQILISGKHLQSIAEAHTQVTTPHTL